jgi:hypothetical protein
MTTVRRRRLVGCTLVLAPTVTMLNACSGSAGRCLAQLAFGVVERRLRTS